MKSEGSCYNQLLLAKPAAVVDQVVGDERGPVAEVPVTSSISAFSDGKKSSLCFHQLQRLTARPSPYWDGGTGPCALLPAASTYLVCGHILGSR